MPLSPPTYRAIPTSEDQARQSAIHEVGADDFHPTSDLNEAQIKRTYFLLGCAVLLSWAVFVNGMSFFLSRLADSPFYQTFSSYLSSVYMVTKLVCQFYCTITSKQSSPSRRIFASMISMILLVTSLCLSTFIRGTPLSFFAFSLFSAASLAVAASYLCTAVYAVAAVLGASFLQTVFFGHGAIAVVASAVQVTSSMISLWGLSPKSVSIEGMGANGGDSQAEELAARIFFGVSALFLGVTLIVYMHLARQPFYKSAISALEQNPKSGDLDEPTRLISHDHGNAPVEANTRVYQVFQQNLIFMFSIAYVFTVSLALFPAITARVQSVNPGIHPLLFTSVHLLVFSVGDFVGRHKYWFSRLPFWPAKKILAASLLRTLFIPLILLCNIYRPEATSPTSPIINSDFLFMIIILVMGFTNGFGLTVAMMVASSLEHNPRLKGHREDVDVVATLGGSSANVGLASGALCSFGVQAII